MITSLQPDGVISEPFNGPAVALSLGAGFVARGFSGNKDHLSNLIQKAMNHKGVSLIDIMQPCVSFNKINTFEWYKKRAYEADNPEPGNFTQAMKLAMEWGDTKFGLSHFNDIERLTIVGDKQWEKTMAAFIKPFTTATVKYFDLEELDAANVWIIE